MLKLKEDCKNSFVSSNVCQNFEEAWQTSYGDKILSEFCSWCKELVALHRTVKLPGKTALPQMGGHGANQVKAASQVYKCILCSGTHIGKKGQVWRYLAACNTFLDMSVPQCWNIISRLETDWVLPEPDQHWKSKSSFRFRFTGTGFSENQIPFRPDRISKFNRIPAGFHNLARLLPDFKIQPDSYRNPKVLTMLIT